MGVVGQVTTVAIAVRNVSGRRPAGATQMQRTGFVLALVSIAVVFVLAGAIGCDAMNASMSDGVLIDINAD